MSRFFELYPWNRLALVAYIVKLHQEQFPNTQLEKTSVQKLVYLFKESFHSKLNCRFRFYNYGPFSEKVAEDITALDSLEVIQLNSKPEGDYEISINNESAFQKLEQKASTFISENKDKIGLIIQRFGNVTPHLLELYATIVWVNDEFSEPKLINSTIEDRIKRVRLLKPKYSNDEVHAGIEFLNSIL